MARGTKSLKEAITSGLLPESGTLVLAVSGGADSVALLFAVIKFWLSHNDSKNCPRHKNSLKKRKIIIAHVNHKLRPTSDLDENFVKAIARRLKITCKIARLRSSDAADKNIEAWARKQRYSALEKIRSAAKAQLVLTAHNQNDVAETFLIKLFQNRDSSLLAVHDKTRKLLRPMTGVPRAEIEEFLDSCNETWREDESNKDESFSRNWIRHKLCPLLESSWGSGIYRTLVERAQAQQSDRLLVDFMLQKALSAVKISRQPSAAQLRRILSEYPPHAHAVVGSAIMRRFYKLQVGRLHGAGVAALLLGELAAVQLPGTQALTIKGDRLRLLKMRGRL